MIGLLGWRGKVGIVRAARVLHAHQNTVVPRAPFAKVVSLEVERGLGPSVEVEKVMHSVDDVESVHARGIDVLATGGSKRGVVRIVEYARGRRAGRC